MDLISLKNEIIFFYTNINLVSLRNDIDIVDILV